jgi:hypothetical protein
MRGLLVVASLIVGVLVGGIPSAWAEGRPIEQFPGDVVRWSTMWVEVPQQMYAVGQADGPFAALTWGPAKGTAAFIESATQELWDALKPDTRPGHSSPRGVQGALFRYEF